MKKLKLIGLILLGILIVGVIAFIVWASFPMQADQNKLNSIVQSDNFSIDDQANFINIKSTRSTPKIALIYYPGARVAPSAYIYKLSGIINSNPEIEVFITKPLLNFAIFGINDANQIIANNADIKTWLVGGHSLGGAMACQFAAENTSKIKGLILFGSYCAVDLSQTNLMILSISGSLDGLSTPEKIANSKQNLPTSTKFVEIKGTSHSQMGNYGQQPADNVATLDDTETRQQISTALTEFLSQY